MRSGAPFALAGIWESWRHPETDEVVRTFAVITAPANAMIEAIHDRMPVVLAPASYERWLAGVEPDPRDLLVPYPSEAMTMWPVSVGVNRPENDDASILARAEATPPLAP
jgi:putative SOS response-associated peptidase YedK